MDLPQSLPAEPAWTAESFTIGSSGEGRSLEALRLSPKESRFRVLILAGQHGDEVLGMEAVEGLAREAGWVSELPSLEIVLLPCMNPDGRAKRQRENADGLDLNRDHQRLQTPEVRALHLFSREYRPDLIIDVHTFPPRRRTLLSHGLEIGEEIMLELSNHPPSLETYRRRRASFLEPLLGRLHGGGVRAARYLLVKPSGRIRTSSADVVDARNGLSLMSGGEALLVEGRERTRRWGKKAQTRAALRAAILEALLLWQASAGERVSELLTASNPYACLGARRLSSEDSVTLQTLGPDDAEPRPRALPGRGRLELEGMEPTILPWGYGVPLEKTVLLDRLDTLGFRSVRFEDCLQFEVERLHILSGRRSDRPRRAARNLMIRRALETGQLLSGFAIFPVGPPRSALSVLLEPQSRYGLHRDPELEIGLQFGKAYPIVRVFEKNRVGSFTPDR